MLLLNARILLFAPSTTERISDLTLSVNLRRIGGDLSFVPFGWPFLDSFFGVCARIPKVPGPTNPGNEIAGFGIRKVQWNRLGFAELVLT